MNHEKRYKCKNENDAITIYDVRLRDPLIYMIVNFLSIRERLPLLFICKYFNQQLIFDIDKQKIKKLSPLLHFYIKECGEDNPYIQKYNIYLYRDDIPNDVWRLHELLDKNIILDEGLRGISFNDLLGSWLVNQKINRTPKNEIYGPHKKFKIIVDFIIIIEAYEDFVDDTIDYLNEILKQKTGVFYKDMDLSLLSVKSFYSENVDY